MEFERVERQRVAGLDNALPLNALGRDCCWNSRIVAGRTCHQTFPGSPRRKNDVHEKRCFEQVRPAGWRTCRKPGRSQWIAATLAWSLVAGVSKPKVFLGR